MKKRVAVIYDEYKAKAGAAEMAKEIVGWLKGRESPIDFAVILGGDSFIMKQAKNLAASKTSVVAVNFGTLGVLATAEKNNWQDVLAKILAGEYAIEKHGLLSVVHYDSRKVGEKYCCCFKEHLESVGDVYIRHKGWLISFSVIVDGKPVFDNIRGDGVVAATPLGSTAYNWSAGGRIINKGVAITPICTPARLKSQYFDEFNEIQILYHGMTTRKKDEGCLLFVDGEDYPIYPGDEVAITKSPEFVSFIVPTGFNFAEARRNKVVKGSGK